jgi:hypothetical protein
MSWSMLEPDDPLVCECKYDEARDEMDQEDCPIHCDLVDQPNPMEGPREDRKPPFTIRRKVNESAA